MANEEIYRVAFYAMLVIFGGVGLVMLVMGSLG